MARHRLTETTILGLLSAWLAGVAGLLAGEPPLRPPAVPLVACDPYFSIWSHADRLTDAPTRHWTGRPHRLTSLVRIDGKAFRVLGDEPQQVPALTQTGVEVLPTRTLCTFAGEGVHLTLVFFTAALPEDLMILARPLTYVAWEMRNLDGREHTVQVYFDATAEPAVDEPTQTVAWSQEAIDGLVALRVGSTSQAVLAKRGDDRRIDWGYFYVAAPAHPGLGQAVAPASVCREQFAAQGKLAATLAAGAPLPASQAPVLALAWDSCPVGPEPAARWLMLAYDDLYGLQYFRQNLRPFWRRAGAEAADLLKTSAHDYPALRQRGEAFDGELMADLRRVGGERYARLAALAYRQCLAGNKVAADAHGQPLLFPKENTSNGCVGTVDVIYPMAPLFLALSPSLTKAMLVPVMDYAASPRWRFPFAPHDLGQYPLANAQVYGGGEKTEENQMPVEETGNLLILLAALAQQEGHAEFATRYWPVLQRWAEFLKAKGFDPEHQLCTDDFAGHLAHNVNLSAKAIIALGAYGRLCEWRGENANASAYQKLAREFALRWVKEADDGDHFRLAFDRPGTWSQKYNLVWDRLLGLDLFPSEVLRKEMDYYRKVKHRYGVALDNRQPYAKVDWSVWTATLTGERADFAAIVDPLYDFLNDTPQRVPMTDWYWTQNAKEAGMHARPVVGGVFLPLLYDRTLVKKWTARDKTQAAGWAALPTPPIVRALLPTSEREPATWRYTTNQPGERWFAPGHDDSAWSSGPAGFGTHGTPGTTVRTEWRGADIWLRREVELPAPTGREWHLWAHHDEDMEVYVNGVLAASASGFTVEYELMPLTAEGRAALKPGKNLVAVHCHQTAGGQYIDVGLAEVVPAASPGTAAGGAANSEEKEKVAPVIARHAVPFGLTKVRLLEGPFRDAMIRDRNYLLSLEPDRLLHTFRLNAGLPSAAQPLGGWETPKCELRGHSLGHYLTACSLMYAASGEEAFKQRVASVVAELAKCQAALPTQGANPGYLSAFPEEFFDRVDAAKPVWAPYYTLHKIMAGLLDAYTHTDNAEALDVVVRLAAWVKFRVDRLSFDQMQRALNCEFGGMNEVLANLYGVTGDPDYARLARAFDHRVVFDPLARGEDRLNGLHANTQVPKAIGAARLYELSGEQRYHDVAKFFWERVTLHRSYVIGGHSDREHFFPVDQFAQHLSPETAETCNTYNMLKLTRHLFAWDASPATMDFYERALYNQILASQDPKEGMFTYFVPLKPGHFKTYSTPLNSFWCCVGTGLENHAKYAEMIYAHSGDSLLVNLFIPSELTWKEKGLVVRQETRFPEEGVVRLTLRCERPVDLPISVRCPAWAQPGVTAKVRGRTSRIKHSQTQYVAFNGPWRDGDQIELRFPMRLRYETLPGDPKHVAFLWGPIVLAGTLGNAGIESQSPYVKDQLDLARVPTPEVPSLVGSPDRLLGRLAPVRGESLRFRTKGIGRPGDVTLAPLYQVHHQRYSVYWRLDSEAAGRQKRAEGGTTRRP